MRALQERRAQSGTKATGEHHQICFLSMWIVGERAIQVFWPTCRAWQHVLSYPSESQVQQKQKSTIAYIQGDPSTGKIDSASIGRCCFVLPLYCMYKQGSPTWRAEPTKYCGTCQQDYPVQKKCKDSRHYCVLTQGCPSCRKCAASKMLHCPQAGLPLQRKCRDSRYSCACTWDCPERSAELAKLCSIHMQGFHLQRVARAGIPHQHCVQNSRQVTVCICKAAPPRGSRALRCSPAQWACPNPALTEDKQSNRAHTYGQPCSVSGAQLSAQGVVMPREGAKLAKWSYVHTAGLLSLERGEAGGETQSYEAGPPHPADIRQ